MILVYINSFKEHLNFLVEDYSSKKFLLAVSGGVDSMALAYLFIQNNISFEMAHVNYHFREEDSNLDQKLVEDFCKNHNIKIHIKDISEEEKSEMKSLQNWARDIRYQFFFDILEKENLDFIVTAHHLNDELETFFINLSRGSGIKGLSGIPKNENKIIRPLLDFSKQEIYDFAKEHHIEFREDQSNLKSDYLRNRIRNNLAPNILEIFPNFLTSFQESLSHLNKVNQFYQNQIDTSFEDVFISGDDQEFILDKEKLLQKDKVLAIEIIRKLGFSGIEIEKVLYAENGKFFRSNSFVVHVKRKELLCVKK